MPDALAAVAVIGGGWAGIAAAVELARGGHAPQVFEAAPQLGGRARAVRTTLAGAEVEIDNGQHLLLGAYRESLRLIDRVRGNAPAALVRAPLRLESTDGLHLVPWRVPAPLHLAGALLAARGLSWPERTALVRMLAGLRRHHWRAKTGETVAAMLERLGQPASLQMRLWNPLVVAALNTDAQQACAQTFANVLRDTLGASRAASDFVLADPNLSQLLAEPAERWLHAHGATLQLRTTVRALRATATHWELDTTRGPVAAHAVVLAVPPFAATRLLDRNALASGVHQPTLAALEAFRYDSIATVYLAWPARLQPRLPRWIMLEERASEHHWGQWLFDRGEQAGLRIAAVVVSARGRLDAISPELLAQRIAQQVQTQLATPEAAGARTLVEKRATFQCTPERPRLHPGAFVEACSGVQARASPLARLALAGDFAYPQYPATLESAVRSGVEAARLLLR